MSNRKHIFAAVFLGLALASAGCSTSREAGRQVDDRWITSQINSSLLADSHLSGLNIHAETDRGSVQLSGYVNSAYQKRRAEEIARSISGVREVENDIEVK